MPPPDAFDQTDLRQTFERARDLFNAQDFNNLASLWRSDIVWKRLHHAEEKKGHGDVLNFLVNEQAPRRPQFEPDTDKAIISPGDGKVSGPAKFRSQAGANTENIVYTFTFSRDKGADPWLLIDARAQIIS